LKTNTVIKSFNASLANFLLAIEFEGRSEKTIQQYKRVLCPFAKFVHNKSPEEITANEIRQYLGNLRQKGLKPATIWTHYKQLRAFFRFLQREERILKNPIAALAPIKNPKVFPRVLKEGEAFVLLKAAKGTGFVYKRNYALISLLLDTGLRASEVCSLSLPDCSLDNAVKVFGKGGRERVVPFSKQTAKALHRYLKARGDTPFEDAFFITTKGDRLTRDRLCRIIKDTAQKAGLPREKVSPHVLRHTFATLWIKGGGDAKRLQLLMGHSDSRTIDVYVHLTAKDLSQAHATYSPLSRVLETR